MVFLLQNGRWRKYNCFRHHIGLIRQGHDDIVARTSKKNFGVIVVDYPLKVVLYWHMHRSRYHGIATGDYKLSWLYLHVIKDFVDMPAQLENNPGAKAMANFTPALLDQIENYAAH